MTKDGMLFIAQLYTANTAAAKQITDALPEDADIPALRSACIAWIRSKEAGLFQEPAEQREAQELPEEIDDMEGLCRDLDYEERIIALMKYGEGLSEETIAQELSLPEEQVKAWLQNAVSKYAPAPAAEETAAEQPKPEPEQKPEEPPAETAGKPAEQPQKPKEQKTKEPKSKGNKKNARVKTAKHPKKPVLSNKFIMAAVAVIAIVLGSFIGVRSYASSQYRSGKKLLAEEQYAEAVEALKNAVAWNGGGNDAILLLGDAYFGTEAYDDALKQYEAYKEKMPNVDMTNRYKETYRGAADKALKAGDTESCVQWLDREYGLTHDERTFYRREALKGGGTYSDVSGNVYDTYGNPIRLVNTRMILTLSYDEGTLTKIDGVLKGTNTTVTLKADTNETRRHTLDAHWHIVDSLLQYYAENTVYDRGEVVRRTILRSKDPELVYNYSYKYDGDKALTCTEEEPDGRKTTYVFGYDSKGTRIMADAQFEDESDPNHITYDHDKDGHLIGTAVTRNIIELLEKRTWTYSYGVLTEETMERRKIYTRYAEEPMREYRRIVYKNTSGGDPLQASLLDRDGNIAAEGFYIRNAGWIWLHTGAYK
jgi:outer membrane biosynthesis protein TonB